MKTAKKDLGRNLNIVSIIASLILFLNGCGRQNYNDRSTDLISIALGSAPSSIDPVRATDATGMRMASLIYQSFVRVGKGLKPAPDLAYKWAVTGKKHQFHIKKNIKFSDGSNLSCNDLVYSIDSYKDKTCPFNAAFKTIKNVQCKNSEDDSDFILSFDTDTDSEKFY